MPNGSEDRTLLSAYVVTNTNDTGEGSLRTAIQFSNTNAGVQTIEFAIPGAGLHTSTRASELPYITDAVIIDATTQPGYVGVP